MKSTSILVRDLPLEVKEGLRRMAALRNHSMEEEARQILRRAVRRAAPAASPAPPASLGHRIHARFAALGGVEVTAPARSDWRALPSFEDGEA